MKGRECIIMSRHEGRKDQRKGENSADILPRSG